VEHRAGVGARGREDFKAATADTGREWETRARVRTTRGARVISGVIAAHGIGTADRSRVGPEC